MFFFNFVFIKMKIFMQFLFKREINIHLSAWLGQECTKSIFDSLFKSQSYNLLIVIEYYNNDGYCILINSDQNEECL